MINIDNKLQFFTDLIEKAKQMKKSGHPILDARWEVDEGRNNCYRRPYYRFCQLLTAAMKPRVIVELGIDEADCSSHFAFGNESTMVIGVDVHKDGESPSERCRMIEREFKNFTYLRGWTWDRLNDVKQHAPIDILYIDSWHEYDYMARDWNDYAPLVAENGIILVDDLHMGQISTAFNEIPAKFRHIDATMNPSIPFGILMDADLNYKFKYTKQAFMP